MSLFASSWWHLVFPPLCLHCDQAVSDEKLLCPDCVSLLQLLPQEGRCYQCFIDGLEIGQERCHTCQQTSLPWKRAAAVWDYLGPAATLVKRLKYGGQQHLAAAAAAFMVTQLVTLEWPTPDAIIPVPIPWLKSLSRGYNQSELLANEMGKLLQVPVVKALKRYHGDYSQAGLNHDQRQQLSSHRFAFRDGYDIADKTVLLVDDVLTTGSTLRHCCDVLLAGYPKEVYALTVCRATG